MFVTSNSFSRLIFLKLLVQPNGFGYRQPGMLHGWRADASNYLIPSVVGPRLHAQRTARRRIGVSSQLQPQFQQLWPVEKQKVYRSFTPFSFESVACSL